MAVPDFKYRPPQGANERIRDSGGSARLELSSISTPEFHEEGNHKAREWIRRAAEVHELLAFMFSCESDFVLKIFKKQRFKNQPS